MDGEKAGRKEGKADQLFECFLNNLSFICV